jgi:hypothetical protein
MAMTKRPDGIHLKNASGDHPPDRYKVTYMGELIGYTQRVRPGSHQFVAEPLDGRPWWRFSKHRRAEEYLVAPYQPDVPIGFGESFQEADEDVKISQRDPFFTDPDAVNRGNRGHARTLNALAHYVQIHGTEPLAPGPNDFPFDLGWLRGEACFVAEVKSLTKANQLHQLRIGLGQVLHYQHSLLSRFQAVVPVLAVEWKPDESAWNDLCQRLGVRLVWPPGFENLEHDFESQ